LRVLTIVPSLATTSRRRTDRVFEWVPDVDVESMSTCVVYRKPTEGICTGSAEPGCGTLRATVRANSNIGIDPQRLYGLSLRAEVPTSLAPLPALGLATGHQIGNLRHPKEHSFSLIKGWMLISNLILLIDREVLKSR
jgi:hypothetical protein